MPRARLLTSACDRLDCARLQIDSADQIDVVLAFIPSCGQCHWCREFGFTARCLDGMAPDESRIAELLDRSEQIQGSRGEISRTRAQYRRQCE